MHHPYSDIIAKLASRNWGQQFGTREEAEQWIIKKPEIITAHALLYFVDMFESMIRYKVSIGMEDRIRDDLQAVEEHFDAQMKERVKKHGACPPDVRTYLRLKFYQRVGEAMHRYHQAPQYFTVSSNLPMKGSYVRDEYDKWMKRKAKRPKSHRTGYRNRNKQKQTTGSE